jgi:hypothetical protein
LELLNEEKMLFDNLSYKLALRILKFWGAGITTCKIDELKLQKIF